MSRRMSIVIPAHNEESVIASSLKAILPVTEIADAEIIVGCNACADKTAEVARSLSPAIRVVETSDKGKYNGLNLADRAADGKYRIYLDADIDLQPSDAVTLIDAMESRGLLAASPRMEVDLSRSNAIVRSFYSIWMQLPYFTDGEMIGSGVFALSPAGRNRFAEFPPIIADDGYVRQLFVSGERATVDTCSFVVKAPQDLKNLIKIKTRARLGNMELVAKFHTTSVGNDNSVNSLLKLLFSRPRNAVSIAVYLAVQLVTRHRAKRQFRNSKFDIWERDDSSRTHQPE